MSVWEQVRQIVAEEYEIDPKTLTAEMRFHLDLPDDSLEIVELIMRCEEEFEIEIPDEDAEKITTVGELAAYIEGKAATKKMD